MESPLMKNSIKRYITIILAILTPATLMCGPKRKATSLNEATPAAKKTTPVVIDLTSDDEGEPTCAVAALARDEALARRLHNAANQVFTSALQDAADQDEDLAAALALHDELNGTAALEQEPLTTENELVEIAPASSLPQNTPDGEPAEPIIDFELPEAPAPDTTNDEALAHALERELNAPQTAQPPLPPRTEITETMIRTQDYTAVANALQNGADANYRLSPFSPERGSLAAAIEYGDLAMVELLLKGSANIEQTYKGNTPLMQSLFIRPDYARNQHWTLDILRLLIQKGAIVSSQRQDYRGRTLMQHAIYEKRGTALIELLFAGAQPPLAADVAASTIGIRPPIKAQGYQYSLTSVICMLANPLNDIEGLKRTIKRAKTCHELLQENYAQSVRSVKEQYKKHNVSNPIYDDGDMAYFAHFLKRKKPDAITGKKLLYLVENDFTHKLNKLKNANLAELYKELLEEARNIANLILQHTGFSLTQLCLNQYDSHLPKPQTWTDWVRENCPIQ
jgi:hypothetical protein